MFDLALWYRTVGGFLGTGSTFLARLRWSIVMGCYMGFAALVHHQSIEECILILLGAGIMTYVGRLMPHAKFQGAASLKDTLGMSVIGLLRVTMIVLPYAAITMPFEPNHLWRLFLGLFGLLMGPAYYVSWKFLTITQSGLIYQLTDADEKQYFARNGGEWGEVLTGEFAYQLMFLTALVML